MSRTSLPFALFLLFALAACTNTPKKERTEDDGTVWVAHAFPTGSVATSAVLLERGQPAQVPVGQPYAYTIKVTNLTEHPLEDVVVSERAGAAVNVDESDPAPASAQAGLARWDLGTLKPKEMRIIKVTATPRSTGEMQSRCEVAYRSLLYGTTTVYEPKLALEGDGVTESLVGEPFTYKLTVKNPGSGPAKEVIVEGALPEGLTTADGQNTYRFDVGELEANGTREYLVQVKGTRTGQFELQAAAAAAGDLRATAPPAMLDVRVATLEITAKGPAEWVLDRDAKYTLTVKNSGDGSARGAMLKLAWGDGAVYMRSSQQPKESGVWNLGELKAGEEKTVEVYLKPSRPGALSGAATLSAAYCDSAVARFETKVVGVPALALEVSDGLDPVGAGGEVTYRIVVRNQGSAPGTNIRVQARLEATMEFVKADGTTKGAPMGDQIVFDPIESLAAGASVEWTVVVKAKAAGDVRFAVTLTSADMPRSVEAAESTTFYGEK